MFCYQCNRKEILAKIALEGHVTYLMMIINLLQSHFFVTESTGVWSFFFRFSVRSHSLSQWRLLLFLRLGSWLIFLVAVIVAIKSILCFCRPTFFTFLNVSFCFFYCKGLLFLIVNFRMLASSLYYRRILRFFLFRAVESFDSFTPSRLLDSPIICLFHWFFNRRLKVGRFRNWGLWLFDDESSILLDRFTGPFFLITHELELII